MVCNMYKKKISCKGCTAKSAVKRRKHNELLCDFDNYCSQFPEFLVRVVGAERLRNIQDETFSVIRNRRD